MRFYKKIGRLTEDEQAVIQQIEKLATQKGISQQELAICHNFDDLLNLLNNLSEEVVPLVTNDLMEQTVIEDEGSNEQITEKSETIEDQQAIEPENSEQEISDKNVSVEQVVSEATAESDTSEPVPLEITEEEPERIASETTIDSNTSWLAQDYDPFSDEIIERSYNKTETKSENQTKETVSSIGDEPPLTESGNTPVDNVNPNTKRKAAEQTASALLNGYAKLAPKPFKWLAKIDEEKIEKLSFDGQIDISIEVSEGMTFDDYMKQTNEQVDEIFEVEQETLDEIREPLVEVLMEQQLELTPQQRLTMAVFSHLMQMLTVALKLRKQNNRILTYQKKITGMNKVQVA